MLWPLSRFLPTALSARPPLGQPLQTLLRRARRRRWPTPARRPPRLEGLEERTLLSTLPAGFQDSVVADGLANPTSMAFAPDGRLFLTLKDGDVRILENGQLLATPFLTVAVDTLAERGLGHIAFDPGFASNRYVYIYYTTTAG